MRKLLLAAATATMLAGPALAATELTTDTTLGTSPEEVRTALANLGYDVRRAVMEDDQIEVYYVDGNTMGEIYVSPETGKFTKMTKR